MDPLLALGGVLALVAAATLLGLAWRARQDRYTTVVEAPALTPADLASTVSFGADATLVQFSTEHCARCPGTRTMLANVARSRPGVVHIEVDLTHRADLARRFQVLQTPTTLILDRSGRVRERVGGAPHRAGIIAHLDTLPGSLHANLPH
ncbi:thioredoxin family protein [Cryobacterium sp. PH31-AA6]|uniref:TlpA family protein disulfide reductase n=1 Tax=Cryobacterium sp. PH31-AA6 TaxID=3046205 RepID=UPI0024BB2027|nr:thioredoxin family protein [Cryobacterium sp. PH31-AA6]MDJ0324016.1 thioredoxin family protein [Cryobacterium sp. PH31-AA6]